MNERLKGIRKSVRELNAYESVQFPCKVKLNQNESPFDIPEKVKLNILKDFQKVEWCRYPPIHPRKLIESLSEYTGYTSDGIIVGNGSTELILTISLSVMPPGADMLITTPGLKMFSFVGKLLGANIIQVPLNSDLSFNTDKILYVLKKKDVKSVFIATPNNPTGSVMELRDIKRICDSTDGLVVIDEAYFEFSSLTAKELLYDYSNLIILRTFSKAFQIASMRIGYMLGNPEIVRQIWKCKMPYSVNTFSQIAALHLLKEKQSFEKHIGYLIKERERVFEELKDMPGIKPYSSKANFIFFEVDNSAKVFHKLKEYGVLVRKINEELGVVKGIRVTVGKKEENNFFLAQLRKVMA